MGYIGEKEFFSGSGLWGLGATRNQKPLVLK
jgi:hypothetical protein